MRVSVVHSIFEFFVRHLNQCFCIKKTFELSSEGKRHHHYCQYCIISLPPVHSGRINVFIPPLSNVVTYIIPMRIFKLIFSVLLQVFHNSLFYYTNGIPSPSSSICSVFPYLYVLCYSILFLFQVYLLILDLPYVPCLEQSLICLAYVVPLGQRALQTPQAFKAIQHEFLSK